MPIYLLSPLKSKCLVRSTRILSISCVRLPHPCPQSGTRSSAGILSFIYSERYCGSKNGHISLILLVGAGRFERPTPCAQGRCATRLRYAPTGVALFILKHFWTRRTPRRGQKLPKTSPTVAKP